MTAPAARDIDPPAVGRILAHRLGGRLAATVAEVTLSA